jgi:hypothetical protein
LGATVATDRTPTAAEIGRTTEQTRTESGRSGMTTREDGIFEQFNRVGRPVGERTASDGRLEQSRR